MITACRITVYGKVQNVGFRFYSLKAAHQLHLCGFVKNEPDGTVYIEAEGDPADLETFKDWCARGPQWARVDRLDIQDIPVSGRKDFIVR